MTFNQYQQAMTTKTPIISDNLITITLIILILGRMSIKLNKLILIITIILTIIITIMFKEPNRDKIFKGKIRWDKKIITEFIET